MQGRTANAVYRDYVAGGGTLTFKQWIDREKTKNFQNFTGQTSVPVNKPLTDTLNRTLAQMHGLPQDKLENKYILGIDRKVLIVLGVAVAVAGGIAIYHKLKK